jgi:DNA-binding transcriptional regulator YiaG
MTPNEIRKLREDACPGANVADSRALFARLFAVSANTVIKWESGARNPSGLALRKLEKMKGCRK